MLRTLIIVCLISHLLLSGCDSKPRLQPLAQGAVILAFGDSLTRGTGASLDDAYPAQLQALSHRKVINAGVPGELSRNGLKRLPALLEKHRPALLLLCHGANDILRGSNLEQTRQNLQQMIELAHRQNSQVVLIGVPKFGIFLSPAPFYAELASRNQIPLENDVLREILKNNTLKSDQIHPNASGYRLLAERLAELLEASGAIQL